MTIKTSVGTVRKLESEMPADFDYEMLGLKTVEDYRAEQLVRRLEEAWRDEDTRQEVVMELLKEYFG